jgi:GH35 family endo-1,4-beta-xylanase
VDSVSLKPFSKEEWAAHRTESTRATRRKTVRLQASDSAGNPLQGAEVSVENVRTSFPLGAAMSGEILHNAAYQQWFTSRFTVTTFENEMKWYSTEPAPGREDYTVADAMLALAKQHGIGVRGHNVFWDDPKQQPRWVQSLPYTELLAAASRRIRSFVSRYAGQLIAWDVVNENLHFSFFERQFGWDASTAFYAAARLLDAGSSLMFMNDFNTLEQPGDMAAVPGRYVDRLKQIIASYPENGAGMAIGLEGHFTTPNIPYMRAALDSMSTVGIPVWLTEVDVAGGPMQAQHLEEVLREAYAHPAVSGVMLWTALHQGGCYQMCLTDWNLNNLPVGDVVDRLLQEWQTGQATGLSDAHGAYSFSGYLGEFVVTVNYGNTSAQSTFSLSPGDETRHITVQI